MLSQRRRFLYRLFAPHGRTGADTRRLEFLRTVFTRRRKTFILDGRKYRQFWHPYNTTWDNERCVEIPVVASQWVRARAAGRRVLEVGNVLQHYGFSGHDMVDKYEHAKGVVNEDVLDFKPTAGGYDLVVSISTFEHIGWDEVPFDPPKLWRALRRANTVLLNPGGRSIATVPLGQNAALDRALRRGESLFARQSFLKRVSTSDWVQCGLDEAVRAEYGSPFPCGNAVLIGFDTRKTQSSDGS